MSYFKHTNGEGFTLNGSDYTGYFHVSGGQAYSEKAMTLDSEFLSAKDTFVADSFLKEYEFDTTYKNVELVVPITADVKDILNYQGLLDIFNSIDENNLRCFKNLILANPTIFNYVENSGKFYGLSSLSEGSDKLPAKQDYIGHIEPLSSNSTWSFLEDITSGVLIVNTRDQFKYICSTGEVDYVLSGSFIENTPLDIIYVRENVVFDINSPLHDSPDLTHNIQYDEVLKKLYFTRNNSIDVYDTTNFEDCHNLILIDQIQLLESDFRFRLWNNTQVKWNEANFVWNKKYTNINPNNPETIRYGKNLRTSIKDNVLYLYNKNSNDVYQTISLLSLGIVSVTDLDIRDVDDLIIIFHKVGEDYKVSTIDPTALSISTVDNIIKSVSGTSTKVKFSSYDSNIFYIYGQKEFQTRFLTNPEYPSGRLEKGNLSFPIFNVWNKTGEAWNRMKSKWNGGKILSNRFNLVSADITIKNDSMYLLFINYGRVYVIKQPVNDRFYTALNLDISKDENVLECSSSSFGLYFNTAILNILTDTLRLLSEAKHTYYLTEESATAKEIGNYDLNTTNLFINGNETVNVITLQRILQDILDIQQTLIPTT